MLIAKSTPLFLLLLSLLLLLLLSSISLISRPTSKVDLFVDSLGRLVASLQEITSLTSGDACSLNHPESLYHLDVLLVSLHVV